MEKEAEMEYECSDCCIAFQDRKSHQAHMTEMLDSDTDMSLNLAALGTCKETNACNDFLHRLYV